MARTAERPPEDDFAVETVLRPAELMLLDMWPGSESGTEDDVADDVAGMASLMWLLSPGMLRGSNSGAEEVEDIVLSMCKRMGCCKSSRGGSRSSRPLSRASGATGGDVAVCLSAFTSSYEAPACDQIMSSPSVTECLSYLARSVTAWWQTTSARTRKPIPLPRFLPAVCFHHHTTTPPAAIYLSPFLFFFSYLFPLSLDDAHHTRSNLDLEERQVLVETAVTALHFEWCLPSLRSHERCAHILCAISFSPRCRLSSINSRRVKSDAAQRVNT